jgi:hypothetical protein
MKQLKTVENGNGSHEPKPASNGIQATAASTVSERDLKMLSLEFIGEVDGTYYFRDPSDSTRTYTGDLSDYREWRQIRADHPLWDPVTAAAARQAMNLQKQAGELIVA